MIFKYKKEEEFFRLRNKFGDSKKEKSNKIKRVNKIIEYKWKGRNN